MLSLRDDLYLFLGNTTWIKKLAAEYCFCCQFISAYNFKLSSQANLFAAAKRLLISSQLTTFHQASK
jgi:hypothetical protein